MSTAAGTRVFAPGGQVNLTPFVDTSSGTAAEVTTTALKEINTWVGRSEPLTVTHVIKGNIPPQKAGVPVGPFDDDRVKEILTTIKEHNDQRRTRRLDVADKVKEWLLPIIVALIVSGVMTTILFGWFSKSPVPPS